MENFLSALAFAGFIAAQFLSVVLVVSTQRCDDPFPGTRNRIKSRRPRALEHCRICTAEVAAGGLEVPNRGLAP